MLSESSFSISVLFEHDREQISQFMLNLDSELWFCSLGHEEDQDRHQLLHQEKEIINDEKKMNLLFSGLLLSG